MLLLCLLLWIVYLSFLKYITWLQYEPEALLIFIFRWHFYFVCVCRKQSIGDGGDWNVCVNKRDTDSVYSHDCHENGIKWLSIRVVAVTFLQVLPNKFSTSKRMCGFLLQPTVAAAANTCACAFQLWLFWEIDIECWMATANWIE